MTKDARDEAMHRLTTGWMAPRLGVNLESTPSSTLVWRCTHWVSRHEKYQKSRRKKNKRKEKKHSKMRRKSTHPRNQQ
jgi:hypothetical protein